MEHLRLIAGRGLLALLDKTPPGSDEVVLDPYPDLFFALERLVPAVLAQHHRSWRDESIDGFSIIRAVRTGPASCELVGTCILISDQTVAPIHLELATSSSGDLSRIRVRLGEAGSAGLGMERAPWGSSRARAMAHELPDRLASVRWVYDVTDLSSDTAR